MEKWWCRLRAHVLILRMHKLSGKSHPVFLLVLLTDLSESWLREQIELFVLPACDYSRRCQAGVMGNLGSDFPFSYDTMPLRHSPYCTATKRLTSFHLFYLSFCISEVHCWRWSSWEGGLREFDGLATPSSRLGTHR